MRETNEVNALFTFLSFLMLPAILLLFFGLRSWYIGWQQDDEDRLRLGKMLTMFGILFTSIIIICSYFLKGKLPG
jgi:hypothetical protein